MVNLYCVICWYIILYTKSDGLDSVYTERYMKTPELNPVGYENSAVNNMTGFRNAKYLLAHGTGDDNGKWKTVKCTKVSRD